MGVTLVGRIAELGTLGVLLDDLAAGRGASVLLVGEPGIGKTSLAIAARDLAVARGAVAAVGSCWEGGGAPAFWPWVQVVRSLLASDPGEAKRAAAQAGPGLRPLVDDVAGFVPESGPEAEFRVFDAIASFLGYIARSHPVVVMLDDLQWADAASVRAAVFVARHLASAPVLLVSTVRSDAGLHDSEAAASLAVVSTNLRLDGLDAASVAELAARTMHGPISDDAAIALQQRTGGNPFFVEELLRTQARGDEQIMASPGLRQILDRRIGELGGDIVAVLEVAAILGREFDAGLVGAVGGVDPGHVDRALTTAQQSGLLRLDAEGSGVFVHDLIRESLRQGVDGSRSRSLHAAAVRVLLDPVASLDVPPSVVAEHAVGALPDLGAEVVCSCLLAAAEDARQRHAAGEEAGYLGKVVELSSDRYDPDIALAYGRALTRSGSLDRARAVFRAVVDRARGTDNRSLARGALGLQEIGTAIEGADPRPDLLQEAIEALDAEDEPAVYTRLLAARSRELSHAIGGDRERADALSARAVELARRSDDDDTLGWCLLARHDSIWRAGNASERLAVASEMSEVAERSGDLELALLAGHLRVVALLELGQPGARGEHRAVAALARATRLPRAMYLAAVREVAFTTLAGDFERAAALIEEADGLARNLDEPDRAGLRLDQLWLIASFLDRPEMLDDDLARAYLTGDPHVVVLETLLAIQRGDEEAVLARAARVKELGAIWPRWAEAVWRSFEVQLAIAAGDVEALDRVREAIEPYADTWAVLGGAILVRGSMHHWSGKASAAIGDLDAAVSSFARAVEVARRLDAPAWAILSQLDLIEALLARGLPSDRQAALVVADSVRVDPMIASLPSAERQWAAIEGLLAEGGSRNLGETAPATEAAFRREDGVWALTFGGTTVRVPDAKGLSDLHTLLSRPGTEVAAQDLLHGGATHLASAQRRLGADPVLDEEARRVYRLRLEAIDEELEIAITRHADERALRLEDERDALLAELARAAGLGGRRRRLGDDTERARKTVTARIRDTLRRLDASHPSLAGHLRDAVTTGTYCRYRPDASIRWDL